MSLKVTIFFILLGSKPYFHKHQQDMYCDKMELFAHNFRIIISSIVKTIEMAYVIIWRDN